MSDNPATTDHAPDTEPGQTGSVDVEPAAESRTDEHEARGDGRADDGLSPLERLQAEKDHLTDVLARTQAEFANYRKRIARDQAQFQDRAKATVLEAFVPALDALDSAAGHDDGLIGPLHKVIADTAERLGLERFEPEPGERFEPTHHEAVAAPGRGDDSGLVVSSVVRPGYRIGTRMLRAAEVVVAASDAAPGTDARTGSESAEH